MNAVFNFMFFFQVCPPINAMYTTSKAFITLCIYDGGKHTNKQ